MGKNLLIVESPSKAKTIKKYLGNDYQVMASVGHIKDLPQKELGIDVNNNFKPKYVTVKGKAKLITKLQDAAKKASAVYLAPDPDREGEAIAWHIANLITVDDDKIHRVLFNEITKSGVKEGFKHPRKIDLSLVNAQQARRILDRLVGYQVSPFLWKTLYRGLSAGRVQSVALRIICEREEEIDRFNSEEYWELFADLKTQSNEVFTTKCVKYKNRKPKISNGTDAKEHVDTLNQANFIVDDLKIKNSKTSPAPLFTTSTFQQEGTRKFRYPPKKIMYIAQQLYEGIEIGGEPVGLITYMRTDSVRISNDALIGIRDFIKQEYGEKYLPPKPKYYKTKKKNVQDAHEGIRPTRFDMPPEKIQKYLTNEQFKIYSLIWKKFVACQMTSAEYKTKTIDVKADEYIFRATGRDLVFDGFLKAWSDEQNIDSTDKIPSKIEKDEQLDLEKINSEQKFTQPPARYTDGTLVKELDLLGIGRPSTYATIVSTILVRKYIERTKGKLIPTDLGKTVKKILVNAMPNIFNVEFTEKMEEELDDVESNKKEWQRVMSDFYSPFKESLDLMNERRMEIKESLQEKTDEKCDKCGSNLVIKWSKNGRFYACSSFPECKYTKPLVPPKIIVDKSKVCSKCASPMVYKEGQYGKFWACSKYPDCKNTLPFTIGVKCPSDGCDGELIERRTKRGKVFYGCNQYPKCKFATWNEPLNKECSDCGYPMLERKETRRSGVEIVCPNCKKTIKEEE